MAHVWYDHSCRMPSPSPPFLTSTDDSFRQTHSVRLTPLLSTYLGGVTCSVFLPLPAFRTARQVTYHIAVDAASIAGNLGVAMNLFREMRARCVRDYCGQYAGGFNANSGLSLLSRERQRGVPAAAYFHSEEREFVTVNRDSLVATLPSPCVPSVRRSAATWRPSTVQQRFSCTLFSLFFSQNSPLAAAPSDPPIHLSAEACP